MIAGRALFAFYGIVFDGAPGFFCFEEYLT
jgi:hypothetical protein